MKTYFVALATVAVVFAGQIAHAKKSPAPAPNISASAKAVTFVEQETFPDSIPVANVSIKYAINHTFSLTAQQEAALLEDTTVTLIGMEFSPGEDPKFENGDKSFSVTKNLPLDLPGVLVPVQFKGKWNKGQFSGSLKVSFKAKDLAFPETVQQINQSIAGTKGLFLTSNSVSPRAENLAYIATRIEHPTISPVEVEAIMASDIEQTMIQGATAEGLEYQSQSQTVQTKFFATVFDTAK